MDSWEAWAWIPLFLAATLRVSTPLIFAAFGGLCSERSGVVNIALEGLMLVGAFSGAVIAHSSGNPYWGFVGGGICGVVFAALYALFVIEWRADQIVAGTALNMLAMGIVPFVGKLLYDSSGSTPALAQVERFTWFPMAFAFFLLPVLTTALKVTRSGQALQFAGEHPEALSAAGISVRRTRWSAVLWSGLLAGWGGATLSLMLASSYSRNMTAGRGFIALAALIFGKWKPVPTFLACLFFGATEAIQMRIQTWEIPGFGLIPVQWVQALPYIITVVVLAGWVGAAKAPRALGLPFRER